MFKCNRELTDLIDLLQAVENEAEAFGRLIKARSIDIIAKDGFWTLKIKYGGDETYYYTRDFETVDELRNTVSEFTTAAKIMSWMEV